jgi:D-glycero-D-manno-heptose 1,7-bisphosphate phosphatase
MSKHVPAVFLDRDGVINRTTVREGTPYPPSRVDEVEVLPGVAEALNRLAGRKLPLIVVTNQPDVARGTQTRDAVEAINAHLARELPMITAFYVCYHDNKDACQCRKPGPGMLVQAAAEHGIDLSRSFMVGDRWSDVVAGAAVGCKTFLLDVPYSQCHRCTPDHVVADLSEAAERILSQFDASDSLSAADSAGDVTRAARDRQRVQEHRMTRIDDDASLTPTPKSVDALRVKIFADGADRPACSRWPASRGSPASRPTRR